MARLGPGTCDRLQSKGPGKKGALRRTADASPAESDGTVAELFS